MYIWGLYGDPEGLERNYKIKTHAQITKHYHKLKTLPHITKHNHKNVTTNSKTLPQIKKLIH